MRLLFLAAAVLFLATGFVGIFVPGLPTTVFVLAAAWCAARGSPRLHGWLLRHRVFGPMIHDWQDGRRVSRRAKRSAAIAMAVCAAVLLAVAEPHWAAAGIVSMAVVLVWLWRRPER